MTLYEDNTVDIAIWKKHFDDMQDNKVDSDKGFYSVKEEKNANPSDDTKTLKTIKLDTPLEQSIEIAKTEQDIMKAVKKCRKRRTTNKKGKKPKKKCNKKSVRNPYKKKKKTINKHFAAW